VPGNSQQVVPRPAPREGLHPYAAGHTDPHSMLGTASLAAVLGARAAMAAHGVPVTLKLFGEPAEKVCGSKPVHAAKGYYDGLDAAVVWHPWPYNTVTAETHFGAYWSAVITFEAEAPSAGSTRRWCRSRARTRRHAALARWDALCLMYTTTKYTKEAMFPHAGSWTLNEFVLGMAAPPRQPRAALRADPVSGEPPRSAPGAHLARARQQRAPRGRAARLPPFVRWVTKTAVGVTEHGDDRLTWSNCRRSARRCSEEALELRPRRSSATLGLEPIGRSRSSLTTRLMPPGGVEAKMRRRACRPGRST
jgi:aminobenzoyl-glutamate utilization protein B